MTSLRIGVMGCADIARRRMLPAMAAADGVEVTAVASRDEQRASELAGRFGARPVHGYEELLEQADVDAVYLPLPAALHDRWIETSLLAGKHVLAEKPLTTDARRTAELLTLAEKSGLALMENVMFVHHPQHKQVQELVSSGAIGELRSLRAEFAIPGLSDGDIRHSAELGGGSLFDTGVYPVRAALHFLGDRLEVLGAALHSVPGRTVDIAGSALLRSPDGVTAQLSFGLDHSYSSRYELWGSEGRITVDRAFTPPADYRPQMRLESRFGTEVRELEPADQAIAAVTAFTAAAVTFPPEAPRDRISLHQARLIQKIRDSATSCLSLQDP
ncbi:Gfo/Idh/MocA family protein [Streptomyces cyaneofuscatus]|uniref:Gfo/Idh/MocA family protein n=1 Tax=Streptomyces cyaneofuscatus TaxID=66883 RepID=UPI003680F7C8